ncbi:uncharacterized protein LOC113335300 [Papaver somniferum]|uniref:uncharacterized protein LOC113335300 n=1 Tax=Papaver somniferum TaxID=3469 RepID=UPI000E6FFAA3|nr:uncharacterized protein LOC113335300 [Papaver somniferum]
MTKYEMSDIGFLKYFLGIEVHQSEDGVFISQSKYAEKVLEKFGMLGCNPTSTPLIVNEKLKKDDGGRKIDETYYRGLIGNLLYLTRTRTDIMFASSMLSRFKSSPSHLHLGAAKRLLSDLGGYIDDMKSTSGYVFSLGSGIFSWASKKQQTAAQSTMEAEYISASIATSHVVWIRRILEDIQEKQDGRTEFFCDNKSAIAICKN